MFLKYSEVLSIIWIEPVFYCIIKTPSFFVFSYFVGILHNRSIPYFKYNSSVFGIGTTCCSRTDRKLIYLIKFINKSFTCFLFTISKKSWFFSFIVLIWFYAKYFHGWNEVSHSMIFWKSWFRSRHFSLDRGFWAHGVFVFVDIYLTLNFPYILSKFSLKNLCVYIWWPTEWFETKRNIFNTKFTLYFLLGFWRKMRGVLSGLLTIVHYKSISCQRSGAQCCSKE